VYRNILTFCGEKPRKISCAILLRALPIRHSKGFEDGERPRHERTKIMKIGALKEISTGEQRVALTPESAIQLQKLGHDCVVQKGAGVAAGFSDAQYEAAGVKVAATAAALTKACDVIVKVRPPSGAEIKRLSPEKTLISFFYPGANEPLMELAKSKGASVIAMDMVPRISRAQKMDALSSMANIAGYRAVIEASNNFGRFFTGQVTAAGKVPPAKVLVVGAGVAGLAAIGTSTSLGAITYAFDVRPEVAEQVESMGAEFVFLDFSEEQADGAATGGYASVSSPEFAAAQLAKFREIAPDMDIVITTALIPNREAPELWTADMVASMKPGSVIVDLAAEKGGNCKLTVMDERIVTDNGVIIIGYTDFQAGWRHRPARFMPIISATCCLTSLQKKMGSLRIIWTMMSFAGLRSPMRERSPSRHRHPKFRPLRPSRKKKRPKKLRKKCVPDEVQAFRKQTQSQVALLAIGGALLFLVGSYAPASFMQHFIVFVLSVFVASRSFGMSATPCTRL
jgi:NAD(P) transhydrogenase subunit alpha